MDMSRDNYQNGKEAPCMEMLLENDQKKMRL